jgi:hypothetical protein
MRLLRVVSLVVAALPAGARAQEPAEAASAPAAPSATLEPPPEGRAEEWVRRRREQLGRLEPYRAGWLERQLLAIEKAERPGILEINYKGFYPRIQSIASGSRNAIGVRLWHPMIEASRVSVHGSAFYSLARYQFYDFQAGRLPHAEGAFPLRSVKGDDVYELGQLGRAHSSRLILYGSLRYQDYTQLNFFGRGPDSNLEDQTTYRLKDTLFELVAGYQFGRRLALTARAGYLDSTVLPGTNEEFPTTQALFDEESAPGLTRQPDYWLLTGQVFLDLRDEPGNPHRGGMLAVQATRFEDRRSSGFRFDRLGVDARGYVALGSPQRVLALRAYLARDDAASGASVPFYLQEFLGGSHNLRGYRNFRFRGTELLLLQAEYRWEAVPAIELVLFADTGKVASEERGLETADFKADWGVGLRFKSFKAVMMRLDVAWGDEGSRALLRFNPSF